MTLVIILVWILFGIGGYYLGKEKTIGPGGGLALGLVLGLLGIIILLCLPAAHNYDQDIDNSYDRMDEVATVTVNNADELQKWFDLKEKGVITDEEFQQKKRALL